jgi:hypothetical protein
MIATLASRIESTWARELSLFQQQMYSLAWKDIGEGWVEGAATAMARKGPALTTAQHRRRVLRPAGCTRARGLDDLGGHARAPTPPVSGRVLGGSGRLGASRNEPRMVYGGTPRWPGHCRRQDLSLGARPKTPGNTGSVGGSRRFLTLFALLRRSVLRR